MYLTLYLSVGQSKAQLAGEPLTPSLLSVLIFPTQLLNPLSIQDFTLIVLRIALSPKYQRYLLSKIHTW